MSRARVLLLLFAGSVAVKALAGLAISQPGYMDAYYYYHVAANLAAGRGFVEDLVWNYLDNPTVLPHPSSLYWLPLTSVLIAPAMVIFGETFRAAQAAVIVLSSLLPLIAFATAEMFGLSRPRSVAVALFTIFSGVFFIYWPVPDVLASFGVVGALALYCTARGMAGSRGWFMAAAGFAALSHLARPDGILFLALLLGMMFIDHVRRERGAVRLGARPEGWAAFAGRAAASVAVYLLVLSPWLYRNMQAIGAPWPSTSEAIFQREYNDVFRYGRTLDLAYYLDWGWQEIILSKVQAAGENLLVFAEPFLFYLLPFGLLGFWRLRRDARAWPYLFYTLILYLVMTLLFTFAGPRGSFLHSMAALLPFFFVACVVGIETAVHWTAGRLKHWVEPTAQRNFLAIALAISIVMSLVLFARSAATWDDRFRSYERAAAWFRANAAPGTPVMVVDPPGWYYSTRSPAVVFASEDLDTNLQIARRFGVRYLLMEAAHPLAMHDFYLGKESRPELALRETIDGIRFYEVLPSAR